MFQKVKNLFCKLLNFVNLVDKNRNLSITNMAVYVLLFKIATAKTLDWPTAAALMLSLINYGHKRKYTTLSENQIENEDLINIKNTIAKIKDKIQL